MAATKVGGAAASAAHFKTTAETRAGHTHSKTPCKFFREGKCTKKEACHFSHNIAAGDGEQVFEKEEEEEEEDEDEDDDDDGGSNFSGGGSVQQEGSSRPICTFFLAGNCASRPACRFSHDVCPLRSACKDWNCPYSNECHLPSRRCWFAESCTNAKCTFVHPPSRPQKFNLRVLPVVSATTAFGAMTLDSQRRGIANGSGVPPLGYGKQPEELGGGAARGW